jgi:hypothetical protein
MITVTREQAICMFYCEEYNETNVTELTKIIDDLKNVEICYLEDPTKPILLCIRTINQDPFHIHTYQSRKSLSTVTNEPPKEKKIKLST